MTGNFREIADFDPDPVAVNNLTAIQSSDVFLLKLDSTGALDWAEAIGSKQSSSANCMDIDNEGNLYIGAYFQDSAFFAGQDTLVSSSLNSLDMFVTKYDNSGNYLWAHAISGFGDEWANGLAVGPDNGIHIIGNYSQQINFDPFNQTAADTVNGQWDFFVFKFGQCSPTTATQVENSCDPFTWIDGNTYTASTDSATWVVPNAGGCDSLITLDLTINTATAATDVQTACGSFTWIDNNTYTSSNNTATFTIANAAGCDSLVTLDLTLNTVDTAVTFNGFTMTAMADSATYSWIDCDNNTPIDTATSQSYTATQNGNYAVVVTQNGCSDTSNCVNIIGVGINSLATELPVKVYPNPFRDAFNVQLPTDVSAASVTLFDLRGVQVWQQQITTTNAVIQPNQLPAGVYTVQVRTNTAVSNQRLLLVD